MQSVARRRPEWTSAAEVMKSQGLALSVQSNNSPCCIQSRAKEAIWWLLSVPRRRTMWPARCTPQSTSPAVPQPRGTLPIRLSEPPSPPYAFFRAQASAQARHHCCQMLGPASAAAAAEEQLDERKGFSFILKKFFLTASRRATGSG